MNIKKLSNQSDARAIEPSSLIRLLRAMALLSCVALVSTLATPTCKAGPPWPKSNTPPTPPSAPEGVAPGTTAVDLTKAYDSHDFRPDVTRDQKIHVHIDFGRVFESLGNFEAALAEYQQALEACGHKGLDRLRSADEALVERRIAGALDRLGRFSQAEVHYKKAIRLSPKDPKIWNDAGYSYYLQGRWADAARTLRTALRYAPDDPRITTNLGLTLAAAGRTKEALAALSRFTGDASGHANLGFLLAATGQVELARDQYLQALALNPNLQLAQRALAQLDRARQEETAATNAPAIPAPASHSLVRLPQSDGAVQQASETRPQVPPPRQFLVAPPPVPSLDGP
jgi:Flp pilus assembly protein TadD